MSDVYCTKEVWKTTKYQGYDVSDQGRVRSYWKSNGRNKATLQSVPQRIVRVNCTSGYPQVNMRYRIVPIHILVLETFVGERPVVHGKRVEARHLNDVKTDNRLCNLRWGVQEENIEDARRNGLIKVGEDSSPAKTSRVVVEKILRMHATGKYMHKDISKKLGVPLSRVCDICSGATWKHVNIPRVVGRKLRITDDVICRINEKKSLGWKQRAIASHLGISETVVSMVVRGLYRKGNTNGI